RSTRPGCERGRLGVLVCLRFAPRRCSYNRTRHPHPVGAPAPGSNGTGSVYWFAFASHRGGAPTIERVTPPRRSTRPGCEWYGLGVLVCLRFPPGRCSYTPPRPPTCRSTRPGCEWYGLGVLVCLRFAPRRCSYNRTRHPHPVGAPAPGANGAGSVFWFAFASHRGGAPTIERVTPPVGASAPGANKRS